jgi:hypothetical protein
MTSFYFMITCDIKLKSFQSMTTADDYDEYLEFQSDLERLETQVSCRNFTILDTKFRFTKQFN